MPHLKKLRQASQILNKVHSTRTPLTRNELLFVSRLISDTKNGDELDKKSVEYLSIRVSRAGAHYLKILNDLEMYMSVAIEEDKQNNAKKVLDTAKSAKATLDIAIKYAEEDVKLIHELSAALKKAENK